MSDLTSEMVKRAAREFGADLCGIGSMDRWEGAPKDRDPRYVFPEAKSCISLAFRIPRGYFRGTEEGTLFSNYTSMGYAGINEVFGPSVMRRLCCFIEDHEYECVPMPNIYFRNNTEGMKAKVCREGFPAPDILIDQRVAAFICGLGEFGWAKVFLTPEFGPFQRFVTLLTEAELEPDPIFEGKLCDRCMCCARGCTGGAISTTESQKVVIAGHEVEFAKIDLGKCANAYRGSNPHYNPFLPQDFKDYDKLDHLSWGEMADLIKIPFYHRHAMAVEAARGCMRECYIHLEATGKLKKKFKSKFRKREPWRISLEGENRQVAGNDKRPDEDVLL